MCAANEDLITVIEDSTVKKIPRMSSSSAYTGLGSLEKLVGVEFSMIPPVSTTFAMFPLCGQNWNHYLLESFCYKYSRKYSLHVIHFNDKNAGIIAEKDFNKKYNEMLAIAIARTDVELSPEVIDIYRTVFFYRLHYILRFA